MRARGLSVGLWAGHSLSTRVCGPMLWLSRANLFGGLLSQPREGQVLELAQSRPLFHHGAVPSGPYPGLGVGSETWPDLESGRSVRRDTRLLVNVFREAGSSQVP